MQLTLMEKQHKSVITSIAAIAVITLMSLPNHTQATSAAQRLESKTTKLKLLQGKPYDKLLSETHSLFPGTEDLQRRILLAADRAPIMNAKRNVIIEEIGKFADANYNKQAEVCGYINCNSALMGVWVRIMCCPHL